MKSTLAVLTAIILSTSAAQAQALAWSKPLPDPNESVTSVLNFRTDAVGSSAILAEYSTDSESGTQLLWLDRRGKTIFKQNFSQGELGSSPVVFRVTATAVTILLRSEKIVRRFQKTRGKLVATDLVLTSNDIFPDPEIPNTNNLDGTGAFDASGFFVFRIDPNDGNRLTEIRRYKN